MIDGRLASHGTQCPFTLATHKWAPGGIAGNVGGFDNYLDAGVGAASGGLSTTYTNMLKLVSGGQ